MYHLKGKRDINIRISRSVFSTLGVAVLLIVSTNCVAEALYVSPSGDVGVGTNTPLENLHAVGNIRTDNYFRGQSVNPDFWIDETGAGNKGANVVLDGGVLQFQRRAQEFGAYEAAPVRVFINAPMNSFVVNASGYLGLGVNPTSPIDAINGARLSVGGVWQNASSRDLKENIHDLDSTEALAAFKALEPVTFNYKVDSEETYLGFIAEDVPEIVASNDRGTLSSMDIIALLTRVVQDQQVTIEDKDLRVDTLERQLAQQSQRMDQLETMVHLVTGLSDTEKSLVVNTK